MSASIIQNPAFETAVAKMQDAEEKHISPSLSSDERENVHRFVRGIDEPSPTTAATNDTNELDVIEVVRQKRKRTMEPSNYRTVRHIVPTSNLVERLLSQAKYIMNDHRKHMSSESLDAALFLKYNKSYWDIETVNKYHNPPSREEEVQSTIGSQDNDCCAQSNEVEEN